MRRIRPQQLSMDCNDRGYTFRFHWPFYVLTLDCWGIWNECRRLSQSIARRWYASNTKFRREGREEADYIYSLYATLTNSFKIKTRTTPFVIGLALPGGCWCRVQPSLPANERGRGCVQASSPRQWAACVRHGLGPRL
jgi:hypothetical protein